MISWQISTQLGSCTKTCTHIGWWSAKQRSIHTHSAMTLSTIPGWKVDLKLWLECSRWRPDYSNNKHKLTAAPDTSRFHTKTQQGSHPQSRALLHRARWQAHGQERLHPHFLGQHLLQCGLTWSRLQQSKRLTCPNLWKNFLFQLCLSLLESTTACSGWGAQTQRGGGGEEGWWYE